MKLVKKISLLILMASILTLSACDEDVTAGCFSASKIEHTIENGEAFIFLEPDTGVRLLSYFVPGTIDSFYTGVLCDDDFTDIQFTETHQRVTFSGHFRDDEGQVQFNVQTGGEEFFYLDLISLTLNR